MSSSHLKREAICFKICIMMTMTEQIREAVRIELAKRKWSQSELARRIDKTPQFISQIMGSERGDVPDYWQSIFDELGLELTVIPKSMDATKAQKKR
jgi:ribosome-binding protein aMBF1 (putative translation factor)